MIVQPSFMAKVSNMLCARLHAKAFETMHYSIRTASTSADQVVTVSRLLAGRVWADKAHSDS